MKMPVKKMPVLADIGPVLRERRMLLGLTQQEIASAAGINRIIVDNVEKWTPTGDGPSPTLRTVAAIDKALMEMEAER